MHLEAERVLPAVLAAAGIKRPILLGHSDGASIALIYAGRFPGAAQGLILEAPHVFVEPLTRASIAAIKSSYGVLDLSRKLARHHRDPDFTFWRWNDIWLDARFADWNIEVGLEAITGPVLMIQGEDDEYRTVAQLAAIRGKIPRAQSLMLADCGHAPHRDQPVAVLAAVEGFVTAPAD